MTRVPWSRYEGADIEAVIGIMLCREFPNATRLTPSSGDGGIDILVQSPTGTTIYQVKKFHENLTANQKRQIEDSWNAFCNYKTELKQEVTAWHLVMPWNPTKEQLKWLETLTGDPGHSCTWSGLDFVEGLVAKYPDVIDYYFNDGKERLDETISRYLQLLRPSNPLQPPAESQETLEELHAALNQFDPHYYYDFSVEMAGPDGVCLDSLTKSMPRLLCSIQTGNGKQCTTFRIVARYDGAVDDRPVPGSMTLQAERDSELAAQIDDWIKYGAPLHNVPAADVKFALPGGFDKESGPALVTIESKMQDGVPPVDITLKSISPDGSVLSELDFTTTEVTQGFEKQSIRAVGLDTFAKIVRYELRMHHGEKTSSINIHSNPFAGFPPSDLLPILRFLNSVQPPNSVQMFLRNGPAFGRSTLVPEPLISERDGLVHISICEDLAVIQRHTFERVLFPDLTKTTWGEIETWNNAASLLRGGVDSGTWSEVCFHMHPGSLPPTEPQTGMIVQSLTVTIGDKTFILGNTVTQFASMKSDPAHPPQQHDDHLDAWVISGDDNTLTIRFAGEDNSPPALIA